jgi:hypothetical protein
MFHPSAARLLSPLGGMVTSFQFSARLHGHAQHEKLTNNKRGRKGYVYQTIFAYDVPLVQARIGKFCYSQSFHPGWTQHHILKIPRQNFHYTFYS